MIIVEASTPTPPDERPPHVRPHIAPRLRLGMMLTGVDGSTWDLYDGPVRVVSGAQGFGAAKPEHRWKSAPAIDGSTWSGSRTPQRAMTLPVYIHTADSMEWRDIDAAFWDAIDPSGECELRVETPDNRWRTLRMRYDDGADAQIDTDPLLLRYVTYALSFIAADPFWHGPPVTRQFKLGAMQPLFPGPPFNINPSNVLGAASIANPGDVETWPVWVVRGPFDGFTVGLGESVVSYVGPAAAGDSVTIDMHPHMLTIRNAAGADRWANATQVEMAALPPGENVDLNLALSGANAETRIELQYVPRYRRAW